MKYIIVFVMTFVPMIATAALSGQDLDGAGFSKLSPTQQAEILKTIAEKTEATKKSIDEIKVPSVDEVEKFSTIGKNVASAIGAAARELGVVANDFVSTPVGIITTGLIIYKVLGKDVMEQIHNVVQSMLFTLIWVSYLIWYLRNCTDVVIKYSTTKFNWRGNPVIESYNKRAIDDEKAWSITLLSLLCACISVALL